MTAARRGLFALAERLHVPVYVLERDMTARELSEWFRYLAEQAKPKEIDIEEVGGETFARMMGADVTEG